jgi:hypothetical protein
LSAAAELDRVSDGPARSRGVGSEPFAVDQLAGVVSRLYGPSCLATELPRLLDPAASLRTLYWGRNYLYVAPWRTDEGKAVEVVVKQFRHGSMRARLSRRLRGSKAQRSFETAARLLELGLGTPAPVLYADSSDPAGPSWYVCQYCGELLEARYLLRACAAGTAERDYQDLELGLLLRSLGTMARRLHEGGVWHRDLSGGNVLIDRARFEHGADARQALRGLLLLDLNRARTGRPLTLSERMRDLSRMPLARPEHRQLYLAGYREPVDDARPVAEGLPPMRDGRVATLLYDVYRRSFVTRHRTKQGVRGLGRRLRDVALPKRQGHAHLPSAERGASSRDKAVWDRLSDQPFQHAGRLEKLRVRIADAPEHARAMGASLRGLPARRRCRELLAGLYREPVPFRGLGVGLVVGSAPVEELVRAVAELGTRFVLLRLYPWRDDLNEDLALARKLREAGVELAFALAQNRELARDRERWREGVARIAVDFAPLGRHFQIGQAINRSKWGIWKPSEYVGLFTAAAEELRRVRADVELLGPAVIDFEPYATAAYLHLREEGLRFDALASLLYVDRRGAPEQRQLGLDLVGKVALLKALAETSPNCPSGRSWITETNWPLREGPHSPAGRDVAVDEEQQASYLTRYYVLALCTGLVERVYWWQLAAKGYGLLDPVPGHGAEATAGEVTASRLRPAYRALRQLVRRLDGASCEGPVGAAGERDRVYRFRTAAGEPVLVGWTVGVTSRVELPAEVERAEDRDGVELPVRGRRVDLEGAPRYFFVREG